MTDEEINRKVAEIEGYKLEENRGECRWVRPDGVSRPYYPASAGFPMGSDFPPPYAIDWAWCGPLIEKHSVCITNRGEYWYTDTYDGPDACDSTPQRAICLAVIAAHEGK